MRYPIASSIFDHCLVLDLTVGEARRGGLVVVLPSVSTSSSSLDGWFLFLITLEERHRLFGFVICVPLRAGFFFPPPPNGDGLSFLQALVSIHKMLLQVFQGLEGFLLAAVAAPV